MDKIQNQISNFFDQYEKRFNDALHGAAPDIKAVTESFADWFIESSPVGVICGKNDEHFQTAIPQGYAHYRNIGITSMTIASKEINLLDSYHAMAKINWISNFVKKDNSKGTIEFQVIYFVRTKDEKYKIFGYITGDEQKALQEKGLI